MPSPRTAGMLAKTIFLPQTPSLKNDFNHKQLNVNPYSKDMQKVINDPPPKV
jgi:hypothetical protein